jgi:hypothetical protein
MKIHLKKIQLKELKRIVAARAPKACMACSRPFRDGDLTLIGRLKANGMLAIVGADCCPDATVKFARAQGVFLSSRGIVDIERIQFRARTAHIVMDEPA